MLQVLIDAGADVKEVGSKGTLMHVLAEHGTGYLLPQLLHKGIDIDASDTDGINGRTALQGVRNLQTLKAFIAGGVDVNKITSDGSSALLILTNGARGPGRHKYAFELLRKGADPNHVDNSGYSAAHNAAKHNDPKTLEMLKAFGANLNRRSREGRSVIALFFRPEWFEEELFEDDTGDECVASIEEARTFLDLFFSLGGEVDASLWEAVANTEYAHVVAEVVNQRINRAREREAQCIQRLKLALREHTNIVKVTLTMYHKNTTDVVGTAKYRLNASLIAALETPVGSLSRMLFPAAAGFRAHEGKIVQLTCNGTDYTLVGFNAVAAYLEANLETFLVSIKRWKEDTEATSSVAASSITTSSSSSSYTGPQKRTIRQDVLTGAKKARVQNRTLLPDEEEADDEEDEKKKEEEEEDDKEEEEKWDKEENEEWEARENNDEEEDEHARRIVEARAERALQAARFFCLEGMVSEIEAIAAQFYTEVRSLEGGI